jgi:hypothetical protein
MAIERPYISQGISTVTYEIDYSLLSLPNIYQPEGQLHEILLFFSAMNILMAITIF